MTLVTDAVAGARRAAPGTTTSVDGGQDADRTADERSYPDEQEAGAWASVISEEASTVISRRPSRRAAVRLGCWRAACTAEGDISAGPITCRFVGSTGRQLFDDAVRLLRCEVGSSFGEPSVSSSCGGHQPRTARVSPRWNLRVAITVVSRSPSGHGGDDRSMVEMSRVLLVALVASSLADIVRPRIPLVLGAKPDGPRGGDRLSIHQRSVINRLTEAKFL